ncbi:MAG: hypothetical protein LH468_09400 [Nocardioides sp.]|nr:hypothetical protein [Nocardioides sp.]
MPALLEPVPSARRRSLRRAVLDHALGEHRRHHLSLVHVGTPGGQEEIVPVLSEEPTDHTLRTDVLAAAFARVGRRHGADRDAPAEPAREVMVWLTRTGPLELQDVDAVWLAAALAAAAEAGLDLTLVVVNRHGWWDPRTGTVTTWRRLRQR